MVILPGEIAVAVEAAMRGVVTPETTVLNLVSGTYAQYMTASLRSTGATVIEVTAPYDDAIDPADVERALREHPEISVVSVVHCETQAGTLNPVAEIGRLAREHGALVICDAASSWGSVDLDPDAWGLDFCIVAPQKCLGSSPGLGPLTVSEAGWAAIEGQSGRATQLLPVAHRLETRWLDGRKGFPISTSMAEVAALEARLRRGARGRWHRQPDRHHPEGLARRARRRPRLRRRAVAQVRGGRRAGDDGRSSCPTASTRTNSTPRCAPATASCSRRRASPRSPAA